MLRIAVQPRNLTVRWKSLYQLALRMLTFPVISPAHPAAARQSRRDQSRPAQSRPRRYSHASALPAVSQLCVFNNFQIPLPSLFFAALYFQQLTKPPHSRLDLYASCFQKVPNPFSSNPFLFKTICVAGGDPFLPLSPSNSAAPFWLPRSTCSTIPGVPGFSCSNFQF